MIDEGDGISVRVSFEEPEVFPVVCTEAKGAAKLPESFYAIVVEEEGVNRETVLINDGDFKARIEV